jgi:hypothetical protein
MLPFLVHGRWAVENGGSAALSNTTFAETRVTPNARSAPKAIAGGQSEVLLRLYLSPKNDKIATIMTIKPTM